jgi:Rrf2 family protein
MPNLLRISDAVSLAMHMMVYLSEFPDRMVSTHEVASALLVSENHLSKVSQRLHKAGLVEASRGPKGGFKLAKPADQITLLNIYEAMEGQAPHDNCLLGRHSCDRAGCIMGGMVESVTHQVLDYFANTTLAHKS